MPLFARIRSTYRLLFAKEAMEAELDAELASYVEMLTAEKIEEGLDPAEARRQALIEVGGTEQVKQAVREHRVGSALDALFVDVRFTLRGIRRSPAFTAVVILILAIGIGATTALFSTLDAVLLRGLPFERPEELVIGLKTSKGRLNGPVSRPDYFDFRDRSRSFAQLAAMGNFKHEELVSNDGRPELLNMGFATWNLFSALGVTPVLGRSFDSRDEAVGGAKVVVISHRLWQARYAGSADAVGRTLDFDGTPYEIVGVLPQRFRFLFDIDVWALIDRQGPIDLVRDSHSLVVVGRLRRGVSLAQAQADVDGIAAGLRREFPATNDDKGLWLGDLHRYMVRGVRTATIVLMATTAFVLLIACGNVAGLLLARGQRRLPELAMRSALGAPRYRLLRQLTTESLVLTLVAGLGGIGIAWLFQRLLLRLLPIGALGIDPPRLDGSALLFALGVSVACGLLVGIVPALRSTSAGLAQHVVAGPRLSEGVRGTRLRSGLVVVQVALSVLLLVGTALLARSLGRLAEVDLGFDAENLLTARVQIQPNDHPTIDERGLFYAALLEKVEAMPGVTSAAAITKLPIISPWQDWPVWPAGQARPLPSETRTAMARWATPGYFRTLGIPLIRGRDLAASDGPSSPRVVVVSESVARGLFPDRDALGQSVEIGWDEAPWRVVGVVGEARLNGIHLEPNGAMYMPAAQLGASSLWLAVKTTGDPMALAAPVREAVRRLDPHALLSREAAMASVVDGQLGGLRVVILSLGLFSAIAVLLTAIGLYGLLAYDVARRSREIGIRLAVGAAPASLVRRFVARGLGLVAGGMLLGVLAAVPGAGILRDLLYGVGPADPLSFAWAFTFLALVGLVACLVPALRVTRLDPAKVLRAE